MYDKRSRTWAEINLENIVHNYQQAKERAGDKRVICVIKADAYGHGAVPVATALSEAGVDFFAVATAEEALQLRRHGIAGEILLLGTAMASAIAELSENDLHLTVGSETIADSYAKILGSGEYKQKIHIKLNSGMDRQGIPLDQAVEQILRISKRKCFVIEGIYTHLAAADDKGEDAFTQEQYSKTLAVVQELRDHGLNIPLFHIANSAGIIAHPYMDADAVRPGIMLYGSNPCADEEVDLKPTMSLHTRISNLLLVKKGESVSYGRTWVAPRDSLIAVLGIGYADGLLRCLSGKLPVLVKGQCVKQVGRICMDMCMIDVTDVPGVKIGDTATIIGKMGENEITADLLADLAETISYEIFCAVGKRVPRIYHQKGKKPVGVCYLDSI